MTVTHLLLGIAVLSTGLFTGLLMTVKFYFERALKDLSGPEFTLVMQRFLKITRTHPLNYAIVLVSGFAPVAVLMMMRESLGSAAFMLTAVGLLAFWCGSILPSTFFAQPLYGVFMSWELDAPPQDWREGWACHLRAYEGAGGCGGPGFVCSAAAAPSCSS